MHEDDVTQRGIDALTKAIEVDLFRGKTPEEIKNEKAELSKFALYRSTLRMLGWQESWGNAWHKRHADGTTETINLPVHAGFLRMESIDAVLRNVTFDMNKLTLWPKIDLDDLMKK